MFFRPLPSCPRHWSPLPSYLWSLGAKVLRARQFPPPGYRVIRDTPVIGGQAAVLRGRGLKVLAVCLALASALLWLLLWRLAWVLSKVCDFLVTFL